MLAHNPQSAYAGAKLRTLGVRVDQAWAAAQISQLPGHTFGSWHVSRFINAGKSAVVFEARDNDGQVAALKIFDPYLVPEAEAEQGERISRELMLKDKSHPNLVRILDGGRDPSTKLSFVVMEFLPFDNLASQLALLPSDCVRRIISQVAEAARFLEDEKLVHRDIKPENIAVTSDGSRAVLLDLGVIRPFVGTGLTDDPNVQRFVGTLQYSSPEFLLRKEHQSLEGWRALTFYQLGAVLHDLIMRRPIFEDEKNPFSRLVNAVQFTTPSFASAPITVSRDLIDLAQRCLIKDPVTRLGCVSWEDFRGSPTRLAPEQLRQRILSRRRDPTRPMSSSELSHEREQERLRARSAKRQELIAELVRRETAGEIADFPPRHLFQFPPAEHEAVLSVSFGPSASFSLDAVVTIRIAVRPVPGEDGLLEIVASCGLTKDRPRSPTDCVLGKPFRIYVGPENPETISPAIQTLLYAAVSAGQERSSSVEFQRSGEACVLEGSEIYDPAVVTEA